MNNLKNIKIIIAYDGSNYAGWQRQQDKNTIQGTIEDTIKKVSGDEKIKLYGSGRTDAGVHALGQVANFFSKSSIPVDQWIFVLNHQLPPDIRIKYTQEVSPKFHARYSAKSKLYHYFVMDRHYGEKIFPARNIFLRNYCYFVNQQLDIKKMQEAADYLLGYHDFSALSCFNQKASKSKKNRTREIKRISIYRKGQFICFSLEANAFLYKMVRVIVGTLINFSMKKKQPIEILPLLKNRDSQQSGTVVPPCGLYLMKVNY